MALQIKVKNNVKAVDEIITLAIRRGLAIATNELLTDIKEDCPYDTGLLQKSLQMKSDDKEGIVYTVVEYAPFVEIKKPFMRNKLYGRNKKTTEIINEEIKKVLK